MDLQENRFVEEKKKEKDEIPLSLLSGVVGMRLGGECGEYQFTGPGMPMSEITENVLWWLRLSDEKRLRNQTKASK